MMKIYPKQIHMNNSSLLFSRTGVTLILIVAFVLSSCKSGKKDTIENDQFAKLAEFIETNGDYINSEDAPAVTGAEELMSKMEDNILIIDIRPEDQFLRKHIPGAVNVPFSDVIHYFETMINPSSFEVIYFISSDGQAAAFVNSLVRLLGYSNTKTIRYGMSSWDEESAKQYWLTYISSEYIDKLSIEETPKNPPGDYPKIMSVMNEPYDVLRERAKNLLSKPYNTYTVSVPEVMKDPSAFYIINYWGHALYSKGHLPGATQYTPKKSLMRNAELNTLPVDKPIVVYCFTGQHSATITAYLRILGYDAYSLKNGTNGFMHQMLVDDIGHAFTEKSIMNYPVTTKNTGKGDVQMIETKKVSPQGGC